MGQVELHLIACPQCNAGAVEFLGQVPRGAATADSAGMVQYTFRCAKDHYFIREFARSVTIKVPGPLPGD